MQSPGAVGGMGLSEGRPLLPPSLPMAFHPDHHGMMMPVPISQPQQHHHHQLASPTASSQATSSTQIQEAHSTTNGSQSEAHSVDIKREFESEMERDKRAIYRHPLFPLMALLFEKCEQATQTPDCPTADSFDVDIQAFVQHQEQDKKPFFSDDPELDGVMVKAIQVLRIHLLELEKVNELCKDFCNRYTSCLKGKLHSENLLRQDSSPHADPDSTNQELAFNGSTNSMAPAEMSHGQVVSGGRVFQMVQTPQGLVAQPVEVSSQVSSTSTSIHGSTPLSQIGIPASSPPNNNSLHSVMNSPMGLPSPSDLGDDDDFDDKKKNKRGVLPKQATQHPYPTEDEKRQIAAQTNLTLLQVNNWFINARRRILQPMLDASLPEGSKPKKTKPQSRPPQRFWPDSLANLQHGDAQSQSSTPNSSQSPGRGHYSGDEQDNEDDDSDSMGLPTPQDIYLPPGVTVTSDCKIIPTSTLNFMGSESSPSMLGSPPPLAPPMGTLPPLLPPINSNNNNPSQSHHQHHPHLVDT